MAQAVLTAPSLTFARSESRMVGSALMQTLRDNAPRIVGGMKLTCDLIAGSSLNPFLMGYMAFSVVGRMILMAYGTKANQAEQQKQAEASTDAPPSAWQKALHPKQYPIESSSAFSIVAESFVVAFGASKFFEGHTGYTPLLLGLVAVGSYVNILFGKERRKEDTSDAKPAESLAFAASESRELGFGGRLVQAVKDNPVLVSSLVQLSVAVGMLIGGIVEGLGNFYVATAAMGILATITQALLVTKQDFNIEGAQASQPPSFAQRYGARDAASTGVQPA